MVEHEANDVGDGGSHPTCSLVTARTTGRAGPVRGRLHCRVSAAPGAQAPRRNPRAREVAREAEPVERDQDERAEQGRRHVDLAPEDDRALAAEDVADDAAEGGGDHAHHHGHEGRRAGRQGRLGARHAEDGEPHGVEPEHRHEPGLRDMRGEEGDGGDGDAEDRLAGSRTQVTGAMPSSRSRKVPPPTPVATARSAKPTMSICLREATSAPVMAKARTPSVSSTAMMVASIGSLPAPRDGVKA